MEGEVLRDDQWERLREFVPGGRIIAGAGTNRLDVLLEGTPRGLDFDKVAEAMVEVPNVQSVHDLHIWSVTSGFVALSGHVDIPEGVDRQQALVELHRVLTDKFDIHHVTLQVETDAFEQLLGQPCLPTSGNCFTGPARPSATEPVPAI